jgi:hypothetical protein
MAPPAPRSAVTAARTVSALDLATGYLMLQAVGIQTHRLKSTIDWHSGWSVSWQGSYTFHRTMSAFFNSRLRSFVTGEISRVLPQTWPELKLTMFRKSFTVMGRQFVFNTALPR